MAVDLDLLNANSITNINTNFTRVQTALQDAVSRSGNLPNHMNADIDMNSNDILNVNRIDVQEFFMDGQPVASIPAFEEVAAIAAEVITVAGISTEVVTVAANISSVNNVSVNIASVNDASANMAAIIAAPAAAALAQKWATEAEDVPVTVGPNLYSAFHWAQKAAALVASAFVNAVVGFTTKATPADADLIGYVQTSDTTGRKFTFADLRVWLGGWFGDPVGQCRFTFVNTTTCRLIPYSGNKIKIAGKLYEIPAAGVDLAVGSLSINTDYNVYAYISGGNITLEAVVTGHSPDTTAGNIGVEIKTGDNTRTLVGKVRPITGPNFVDSLTQRFVISWFNRRSIMGQSSRSVDDSTSSLTLIEISTALRTHFLCWADETVEGVLTCLLTNNAANNQTFSGISLDGNSPLYVGGISPPSAGVRISGNLTAKFSLTEGFHYTTAMLSVNAGTGTILGGFSPTKNDVTIRG